MMSRRHAINKVSLHNANAMKSSKRHNTRLYPREYMSQQSYAPLQLSNFTMSGGMLPEGEIVS
jgi:hypothetical protein